MMISSSRMAKGNPIKHPDRWVTFLFCSLLVFACEDKMYECTRHDSDGNLKYTVPCDGNGVYMGEYLEYHRTGRLWKRSFYVDGLEEDTTRLFFYQTGNVLKETPMLHGKKHGAARTFRQDGTMESLVSYHEGRKHGPSTAYYDNGLPQETISYQEGQISGPYMYFAPDCTLILLGEYHNGAKYGDWLHYDYDGKPLASFKYYNDQKSGAFEVLRSDGNTFVQGTFDEDVLTGEIRYFSSAGSEIRLEQWDRGRSVGRSTQSRMPDRGKAILYHPEGTIFIMPDTVWINQY